MKVIINKNLLLENIKICSSITESYKSSPVFLGMLIEVTNNEVKFTSTNGIFSVNSYLEKNENCLILETGIAFVKTKNFYSIISKLNNEAITIEKIDNSILKIKTSNFDSNINLMDESIFPSIDFFSSGWKEINIPSYVFKKISNKIKQSIEHKKDFFSLFTGVSFSSNQNDSKLKIIGTDKTKLSYYEFDIKNIDFNFVLDIDLINLFLDFLTHNTIVKIFILENNLIIKINNITISSKTIHGEFPSIAGILNLPKDSTCKVNRKKLIDAIERGIVVTTFDKKPIIKFKFEQKSITINSSSAEFGTSQEIIDCEYSDKNSEFIAAFNGLFVISLLKVFENDIISIHISKEKNVIFLEDEKEKNFIQILSAVKIN